MNNILAIIESMPVDPDLAVAVKPAYQSNMGWAIIFNFIPMILIFGLYIGGIIWFVRYLKRSAQERQRLRMELGRIGNELEQLRKQMERK